MITSSYISAFVQAMGWVLLHSLWQITLILLAVALLFRFVSVHEAQIRYRISLSAFVLLMMISGGTFVQYWQTPGIGNTQAIELLVVSESIPLDTETSTSFTLSSNVELSIQERLLQLFLKNAWIGVGIWFLGICLLSLRHIGGWLHIRSLSREGGVPDSHWRHQLANLQAELGIRRPVKLVESIYIVVPVTFGWIKPVILFPTQLLTGLSEAQIQLLLIHELAHIRRADYLINLGVLVLKTIFFYHPGIYLLSSWMDQSREACCDDTVVSTRTDRELYAETLIFLQRGQLASHIAMGALGQRGTFPNRLMRLFGEKPIPSRAGWPLMLMIGLMVSSLIFAFQPRSGDRTELIHATTSLSDSISMQMKYPGIYEVINSGNDPAYIYLFTEKAGDAEWRSLEQNMADLGLNLQIERVEASIKFSLATNQPGSGNGGQYAETGIGAFFYYPEKKTGKRIAVVAMDTNENLHNGVFANMTHGMWLKECIRRYDLAEVDPEPVRENKLREYRPNTFEQRMKEAMGKDSILFVIDGEQFLATDAHRVQQALTIPNEKIGRRNYIGLAPNRIATDYSRIDAHTVFEIETKMYREVESLKSMYSDAETGFLINGFPLETLGLTPVQFFDQVSVDDFLKVTVSKGKTASENLGFPAKRSVISIVIKPGHPLLERNQTTRQVSEQLSVFPNPTQNIATIDITLQIPDRLHIQIIDMSGSIVWESQTTEYQPGHYQIPVALSAYPAGYYVIRVLTREGVMQGLVERSE